MENVVLVDECDRELGVMEKQEAHIKGVLHRAISVFVFNSKKELLLQQRAAGKYHSALLWTNTCCSHPRPGEAIEAAAGRRLYEEMGIGCVLEKSFDFVYKASFENGLIEHEYDHVFIGTCNETPHPNEEEVASWKYISLDDLKESLNQSPESYTPWFIICMNNSIDKIFPL